MPTPPTSCSPRWIPTVRRIELPRRRAWCWPTPSASCATCRTNWSPRSARPCPKRARPTCCCTSSTPPTRCATSASRQVDAVLRGNRRRRHPAVAGLQQDRPHRRRAARRASTDGRRRQAARERVWLSARDGAGLDLLRDALGERLGLRRVCRRAAAAARGRAPARAPACSSARCAPSSHDEHGWRLQLDLAVADAARLVAQADGEPLRPLLPEARRRRRRPGWSRYRRLGVLRSGPPLDSAGMRARSRRPPAAVPRGTQEQAWPGTPPAVRRTRTSRNPWQRTRRRRRPRRAARAACAACSAAAAASAAAGSPSLLGLWLRVQQLRAGDRAAARRGAALRPVRPHHAARPALQVAVADRARDHGQRHRDQDLQRRPCRC